MIAHVSTDELLKLYKTFIQTHANADSALQSTVQKSAKHLKQHEDAYALMQRMIHEKLPGDIESASIRVKAFVEKMLSLLDAKIQDVTRTTSSTIKNVKERVIDLDAVSLESNSLPIVLTLGACRERPCQSI